MVQKQLCKTPQVNIVSHNCKISIPQSQGWIFHIKISIKFLIYLLVQNKSSCAALSEFLKALNTNYRLKIRYVNRIYWL